MPNGKFFTETATDKYRILVTHPHTRLSQEIIRQLKNYPQVETVTRLVSNDNDLIPDFDVILHVAGFESSSLSQTISFTSYLHSLLDIARDSKSKFYLIVPQKTSNLIETAVILLSQFAKTFSLVTQVIEVVEDDVLLEAEAIIKKIIKNHHAPAIPPVPVKPLIKKTQINPTPAKPQPTKANPPQLINIKKPFFYFVVLITILLFPWSLTLIQAAIIPQFINCSYKSLSQGNLDRSQICSKVSSVLTHGFSITSRVSFMSDSAFEIVGLPLQPLISTMLHLSNALNLSVELTRNYTQVFTSFLGQTKTDYQLDVPQLTYKITSLTEQLAYLQSDMRDLYLSSTAPPAYIETLATKVSHTQQLINKVQKITVDLPNLLSQHRSNTYLVLIQDNLELRPTGGFIDSFLLITAENSRINDIQLFSSSLADSRLKGQVSPPSDLKYALGETSWYLRDSNWDPDFSVSAQKAAWFVEKELSRPVDVVIALNWTSIQEMLEQVGPQTLKSFNLKLDQSNVLGQYINQVLPAGSSTNNSFIYDLTQTLITNTHSFSQTKTTALLLGLLNLADKRQLLVFPVTFKSDSLKIAGWNGEILGNQCTSQNLCYQDYFYLVHSNVGINKSDYYVTSKTLVSVEIQPNNVIYAINLQIKNSGPQTTWPTGKYRDYLRIYLPQSTEVNTVKLNGQELARTDYSISFSNGLPVLSVLVEVPPSQASELEITARKNINLTDIFHYQFTLPNQPGLLKNSTQLTISYPPDWPATVYEKPAVASEGRLQYNASGDESLLIDIDFSANK